MIIQENKQGEDKEAGSVQVEFYTDPLCCWSWGFEPQWRRLRFEYRGKIKWRYRMGGLIPNWESFNDPMNSISRPLQMGPLWMEARYMTGMPIADTIWFQNPPSSSYPACIAVKAAELQSPVAAERFLRKVREAVMLQRQDISDWNVLLQVGKELAKESDNLLNIERFTTDLSGRDARKAFEEDLKQVRIHSISRFPTLTMRREGAGDGVMIVGYRPYEALEKALHQIAPELEPVKCQADEANYRKYWAGLTERELQEVING